MLYIHIPFCKHRCIYCDFYSTTLSLQFIHEYLDAVKSEISQRAHELPSRKLSSVYIGGGTPSLMPPNAIKNLFASIQEQFIIDKDAEVTFEANPEDVSIDLLNTLYSLGVNRISLGVQSFDNSQLTLLNRRHSAIKVIEAVDERLKSAKLTADWEINFNKVVNGEMTEAEFNDYINDSIESIFAHLRSSNSSEIDYVEHKFEKKVYGRCPWCGGDVVNIKGTKDNERYDYFACDTKCGFKLYRNSGLIYSLTKKELTDKNITHLLEPRGFTATCISKDGNSTYKANIKVKNKPKMYNGKETVDYEVTYLK